MQLWDLFDATFAARRDEIAVEFDQGAGRIEALTFREVRERALGMTHVLEARGVARGDRLSVYLSNSLQFLDLFLACTRSGVVFVPINVLYREREIAHIVGDAQPRAVVSSRDAMDRMPAGAVVWDVEELATASRAAPCPAPRAAIEGREAAALIYTSGTTGKSKGAVLTHNNFLVNAASLCACWRITFTDRYLAVLPLFHVHGLANGVLCWLASGCRMRLVERFDAARAADLFARFRPTLFFGVPTVYVRLLELPADTACEIGSTVRLFVSGSAPLPPQVFGAFRERFGHAILERYGMSETLMNISNPYARERRPGTVGFPLPGVDVRILTEQGEEVGDDEVGELYVRGPNVCAGYWQQPEATAEAFKDDWFRTGDLGMRSPDGYYTLRGRRTELIISGGFNVYPREIEERLLECSGVREVAVVGVPDPRRGEVCVAYIVAESLIDEAALEAACRRSLASFKVPRGFVQVDALPRTALGKIQKHLLPPWMGAPQ